MTRAFNRAAAAVSLSIAVAACVPSTSVEQPAPAARPAPPTFSIVGLESVMGRDARALQAQFGRPELDVREGSARKLQFANQTCVLDAYLYPPSQGAEPIVTYIDARLLDGRDVDRASCVAALGQASR